MTYIPQLEPITTLKKNHLTILKKLSNGPVFLSQRSKMAAVLLSTSEFEALMKDATQYRRMILADQHSQEMDAGQYVTQEDFEAGLKERGLL
jgi:PHD/YefM family antitoxin component YafN of YafNO toxin-antitoxin module